MGGVDEEDVEEHLCGLMEIGVIREADGRLEVVLEEERAGASAKDRDMPGSGIAGATAHHPTTLRGNSGVLTRSTGAHPLHRGLGGVAMTRERRP
ncbi:MAG: hypothetical protein ACP5UD_07245 [Conexivisphaera sp.]